MMLDAVDYCYSCSALNPHDVALVFAPAQVPLGVGGQNPEKL